MEPVQKGGHTGALTVKERGKPTSLHLLIMQSATHQRTG